MKKNLSREALLLGLSSAPILISFYILSIDAEWARRFIKVQLVGTSLSSWLTLGLAPTLSALSLASKIRPPHWLLLLGSFACPLAVVVMWLIGRDDLTDAALIASLATIAILYRLPARRIMGRAILLGQFLVIAHEPGRAMAAAVVAGALMHLACLGAFKRGNVEQMGLATVGHAYFVSVVKDFFYRGHYLILSSFGLAGQNYAAILRLLDISSRPTDYLFQRLVDEDKISSRLGPVLTLVPASAGAITLLLLIIPSFSWASTAIIIMTSIASGLVTLTKYLAYEQNAKLRFMKMTVMYFISALLSAPLAFLEIFQKMPIVYFLSSLCILTFALLTLRSRVARESS